MTYFVSSWWRAYLWTFLSYIYCHSEVKVAQLCPTLCDPMDYSLPGSSVHGVPQATILEWVSVLFSRGFFPTQGSNSGIPHCRQILYHLSHLFPAKRMAWHFGCQYAGIKMARRNINHLRYADDTTLMAENKELKSPLMKVKEESEKVGLKLNIQETKIMASGPITS